MSTFIDQNHPQKDTLGTQIRPQKIIFGHFPIEIPIEVEKSTHMEMKGPRVKTQAVADCQFFLMVMVIIVEQLLPSLDWIV